MTTIREQIIAAAQTKLADITTAKGYRTNIGANVVLTRYELDPEELPACIVWPKPEDVERAYGANECSMGLAIEAISAHGSLAPVTVSESMLADVIECLTGATWTWAFTTGTIEIEVGDALTGAVSGATMYVQAITVTSGSWAGHDAAGTLTLRRLNKAATSGENLKLSGAVACKGTLLPVGQSKIAAMGSLLTDIKYISGGTSQFPAAGELTTGMLANFELKYRTLAGNPYSLS